jgi:hypothetical protein
VYGHVCDWLATSKNDQLKHLLYDDACHLAPFARNETRRKYSHVTEKVAKLTILLDKLHFPGHIGELFSVMEGEGEKDRDRKKEEDNWREREKERERKREKERSG